MVDAASYVRTCSARMSVSSFCFLSPDSFASLTHNITQVTSHRSLQTIPIMYVRSDAACYIRVGLRTFTVQRNWQEERKILLLVVVLRPQRKNVSLRAASHFSYFFIMENDDPDDNDINDDDRDSSQESGSIYNEAASDEENSQAVDEGSSDEEKNPAIDNIDRETIDLVKRLTKSNPLMKAYRKVRTKKRTEQEITAFKAELEEYLLDLFSLPFCFSPFRGCFVSFRCIQNDRERYSLTALSARLGEWFYSSLFPFLSLMH
jgi:hypothetical protein